MYIILAERLHLYITFVSLNLLRIHKIFFCLSFEMCDYVGSIVNLNDIKFENKVIN